MVCTSVRKIQNFDLSMNVYAICKIEEITCDYNKINSFGLNMENGNLIENCGALFSANSIAFADDETNLSIIYYYFACGYNNHHQMKMNHSLWHNFIKTISI